MSDESVQRQIEAELVRIEQQRWVWLFSYGIVCAACWENPNPTPRACRERHQSGGSGRPITYEEGRNLPKEGQRGRWEWRRLPVPWEPASLSLDDLTAPEEYMKIERVWVPDVR